MTGVSATFTYMYRYLKQYPLFFYITTGIQKICTNLIRKVSYADVKKRQVSSQDIPNNQMEFSLERPA